MAATDVRYPRGLVGWSRSAATAHLPRGLPEWVTVGVAGLVLGVVAARVATSPTNSRGLVLFAALVPFLLMLVRDVRRTLLVVVVFDTALQWDKNFGYDKSAADLGALGGLNISATTIALAVLYLLWFAEMPVRKSFFSPGTFRAALPLTLYVGFTALSIVAAENKALAAYEIVLLLQMLLLFVYVAGSVQTRDDVRFLVTLLAACLLVESVLTLALPFVGGGRIIGLSTYAQADPAVGGYSRFGGTIGSPNAAGAFFALLIALMVALAAVPISQRTKRLAIAAVPLATAALILTLSRGGWVALVVSFIFLTVAGVKRGWLSPRIPIACAVVLTIVALPFSGTLATRITGSDRGSAASRVPLDHLAATVIKDHPVLGVGANNLGIAFPKYAGPQYSQDWIYTVHNKYLLVWAEAGTGAFAAFAWFLFSTLRRGWSIWRSGDPLFSLLALALIAGLIGQMVEMTVELFQSRPEVQGLLLVAALLVAMQNVVRRTGEAPGRTRSTRSALAAVGSSG